MAKKPGSRIPSAVGSIPLVGDLARSVDGQAQWLQELLEQNARLVGQLPATLRSFNDSLERFNQTVGRLDAAITRIESAGRSITGPVEKLAGVLDPAALRELPEAIDSLRREALPAMQAATSTQRQLEIMQANVDLLVGFMSELPGAGLLRRFSGGRVDPPSPMPPADGPPPAGS